MAAGRRLHLTPSALSHQLRQAEGLLGTTLFQRRHRRLLLTAAGERFLDSARKVLAEIDRAEAGARRGEGEQLIRLSTGCYTVYGWLGRALLRFADTHPDVEVRVVLEATQRPLEALLDGSLDLALTSTEPGHPRLVDIPLFRDELVLVVPVGHRLADRSSVRPEDLAGERLLTYDAPREELDVFRKFLWPGGVEPARTQRVPLTEAMVELVAAGVGVTALATWALKPDDAKIRILKLGPRGVQRVWRAVHLRTRAGLGPIQQFVSVVRGLLPSPVTGLRMAPARAPAVGHARRVRASTPPASWPLSPDGVAGARSDGWAGLGSGSD